ncbi:MAG: HutD family protein [Piscinibacter sp.]|uniref:HutD/Ves family protein n=1 Tax=Piscinibacter TaxID=1114981 RepID=UPI0013E29C77|nr:MULTISPECIES: HutD family protein [Piscinibacter]MCW5664846.1 HutD family protein [Piscinibacter sp.]
MSGRFALDALPWQAWKNGAGRTREIAVEPPGAGLDDFGWRISVAEVAADAPFSAYPGVDRCSSLLQGNGMMLRSHDGGTEYRLDRPLEPLAFDGGMALQACLIDGPCLDFNLMTRRGPWRGEVVCVVAPARLPEADALLVLAVDGAPEVEGDSLRPGEGRVWRTPVTGLDIGGSGRLLAARLTRQATA